MKHARGETICFDLCCCSTGRRTINLCQGMTNEMRVGVIIPSGIYRFDESSPFEEAVHHEDRVFKIIYIVNWSIGIHFPLCYYWKIYKDRHKSLKYLITRWSIQVSFGVSVYAFGDHWFFEPKPLINLRFYLRSIKNTTLTRDCISLHDIQRHTVSFIYLVRRSRQESILGCRLILCFQLIDSFCPLVYITGQIVG